MSPGARDAKAFREKTCITDFAETRRNIQALHAFRLSLMTHLWMPPVMQGIFGTI
jgi:hypothetical protein